MAKKRPKNREEILEERERDARAELAGLGQAGALFGLTDMKAMKLRGEERRKEHDPTKVPVYGTKWRNFAPVALFLFLWALYFLVSQMVPDAP